MLNKAGLNPLASKKQLWAIGKKQLIMVLPLDIREESYQ